MLRDDARTGVVSILPVAVGVIPFGLVFGIAAGDAGLDVVTTEAFSIMIFAGAAQLAAVDLLARDAAVWVAATTALVINLRMLMYGASLAPYIRGTPGWARATSAYLLTDQTYAVTVVAADDLDDPHRRLAYFTGAGVTLWVTWQTCSVVGLLVGAAIPDTLPLPLVIPLVFLALLPPAVRDRPGVVAAVVGGAVATLALDLPANAGMPLGALAGIAAGVVTERRTQAGNAGPSPLRGEA